jgi:hypothetical protein
MVFRPLSQRNNPDPAFDGPYEGLPPWLLESVLTWLSAFLYREHYSGNSRPNEELLREAETTLHLRPPLDWSTGGHSAIQSVRSRVRRDDDFALDFVDLMLSRLGPGGAEYASTLNDALTRGGSVWQVEPLEAGHFQLVRRAIGPVAEAIDDLRSTTQRAHAHLMQAWSKLMGRNPDPSTAYREAIRAVEVVAAPVVTPDDKLATLGKVIKALRDKPEKWTVDLVEATPGQVTEMAAMLWQSQFDRHGTHDESVPLNVSQEQADAAVHIAIALVRLFAGGHVSRVS